jgi:hypothetical protein
LQKKLKPLQQMLRTFSTSSNWEYDTSLDLTILDKDRMYSHYWVSFLLPKDEMTNKEYTLKVNETIDYVRDHFVDVMSDYIYTHEEDCRRCFPDMDLDGDIIRRFVQSELTSAHTQETEYHQILFSINPQRQTHALLWAVSNYEPQEMMARNLGRSLGSKFDAISTWKNVSGLHCVLAFTFILIGYVAFKFVMLGVADPPCEYSIVRQLYDCLLVEGNQSQWDNCSVEHGQESEAPTWITDLSALPNYGRYRDLATQVCQDDLFAKTLIYLPPFFRNLSSHLLLLGGLFLQVALALNAVSFPFRRHVNLFERDCCIIGSYSNIGLMTLKVMFPIACLVGAFAFVAEVSTLVFFNKFKALIQLDFQPLLEFVRNGKHHLAVKTFNAFKASHNSQKLQYFLQPGSLVANMEATSDIKTQLLDLFYAEGGQCSNLNQVIKEFDAPSSPLKYDYFTQHPFSKIEDGVYPLPVGFNALFDIGGWELTLALVGTTIFALLTGITTFLAFAFIRGSNPRLHSVLVQLMLVGLTLVAVLIVGIRLYSASALNFYFCSDYRQLIILFGFFGLLVYTMIQYQQYSAKKMSSLASAAQWKLLVCFQSIFIWLGVMFNYELDIANRYPSGLMIILVTQGFFFGLITPS